MERLLVFRSAGRFIRWLRSFREEPVTAVCTADRPVPQLYSVVDADRGLLKPLGQTTGSLIVWGRMFVDDE